MPRWASLGQLMVASCGGRPEERRRGIVICNGASARQPRVHEMRDLIHGNLNVFVGACVDPPNICILWMYCQKGSIQDIVENEDVKIDKSFKLSLITDLSKALEYIHRSHLHSHGNLKSSNCVVDNRWVLKVTDYGLGSFTSGQRSNPEVENSEFLAQIWTAPEILRQNFPGQKGTQKGDVYSFAIICYEIMMRSAPYSFDNITPRDVINRVRSGESVPFRPHLPEYTELGQGMLDLIKQCWTEQSDQRPPLQTIRKSLRKVIGGEINILDNMMNMMEKYSNNLEEIVEERTQQLVEEKKKTDALVYRMLPPSVADSLKLGKAVEAEQYDQATIYFSDVVGFSALAADSSPIQIVDFLNGLYTCFDDIIDKYDVYKVETISDSYMCVSGVPVRNGTAHAGEMATCALHLLSSSAAFKIKHRPKQSLNIRIGLHTGPVVAGVVGLIMPRYCLFGDPVNTAARMESSGKPLRIHISKQTYIALEESKDSYLTSFRGEMNVKGKGLQQTYWLYGKKGFDLTLPKFEDDANHNVYEGENEMPERVSRFHGLSQSLDSVAGTGMPAVV